MSPLEIIGVLSAIFGLIVLIAKVIHPIIKSIKSSFDWMDEFKRDWQGEESSLGRDRTPGVMERLNILDGELSRNGGKSLKDVVCRLEEKIDKIINRVEQIEKKLEK
jgi:hypothetical protein